MTKHDKNLLTSILTGDDIARLMAKHLPGFHDREALRFHVIDSAAFANPQHSDWLARQHLRQTLEKASVPTDATTAATDAKMVHDQRNQLFGVYVVVPSRPSAAQHVLLMHRRPFPDQPDILNRFSGCGIPTDKKDVPGLVNFQLMLHAAGYILCNDIDAESPETDPEFQAVPGTLPANNADEDFSPPSAGGGGHVRTGKGGFQDDGTLFVVQSQAFTLMRAVFEKCGWRRPVKLFAAAHEIAQLGRNGVSPHMGPFGIDPIIGFGRATLRHALLLDHTLKHDFTAFTQADLLSRMNGHSAGVLASVSAFFRDRQLPEIADAFDQLRLGTLPPRLNEPLQKILYDDAGLDQGTSSATRHPEYLVSKLNGIFAGDHPLMTYFDAGYHHKLEQLGNMPHQWFGDLYDQAMAYARAPLHALHTVAVYSAGRALRAMGVLAPDICHAQGVRFDRVDAVLAAPPEAARPGQQPGASERPSPRLN